MIPKKQLDILSDESFQCYVTHVTSPDQIYVRPLKYENQLNTIMSSINNEEFFKKNPVHNINSSTIYAALSPDSGCLHRAVVKADMGSSVIVQYIDYGKERQISRDDIFELQGDLSKIPFLCISCSISFSHTRWNSEHTQLLRTLLGEDHITCIILQRGSNNRCEVEFSGTPADTVNLANFLKSIDSNIPGVSNKNLSITETSLRTLDADEKSQIPMDIAFLDCAICLEQLSDPQALVCMHSFCRSCLEKMSNKRENIDCPICRQPTAVGSWKKDFRTQEFIDYIKRNSQTNSTSFTICSVCNTNLLKPDVHLCKDCSKIFCLKCSDDHKISKKAKDHSIHPLISEKLPMCTQHNEISKFFCCEPRCKSIICGRCAVTNHRKHSTLLMRDQAKTYLNEISDFARVFDDMVPEVNAYITRMENNKRSFERAMNETEVALIRRRDHLLEMARSAYDRQITKIQLNRNNNMKQFNECLQQLNSIKRHLDKLKKDTGRYLKNKSDVRILKEYEDIKNIAGSKLFYELKLIECSSASLVPKDFDYESNLRKISSLLGDAEIMFNETNTILSTEKNRAYFDTVCHANLKSQAYECKSFVYDICYNPKRKSLVFLENLSDRHSVKILYENGYVKELTMEQYYFNYGNSLAFFSNGNLLLLCASISDHSKQLLAIPHSLANFKRYRVRFFEATDIQAICSSPCHKFIFFYSQELNSICKYNADNKLYEISRIGPPSGSEYMAVSENLDHIVFGSGCYFKMIYLVSFRHGRLLGYLGANESCYCGLSFLSETIVIGVKRKGGLEVIDVGEGSSIKTFINLKISNEDGCVPIRNPFAVTKRSQSSIYVIDDCGQLTLRVYQIQL